MAITKLSRIQNGIAASARLMRIGGTIFRPAKHGEDNRFEEEQSKAGRDSGNDKAALAHRSERNKVERDQQSGKRHGHASGAGEGVSSLSRGKEIDGAMRQQQHQQGKQNPAGIEAPGKKQPGNKHADIIKGE